MNNKQINTTIAEACGWKWHDHPDCMAKKQGWSMPETWIMRPDGTLVFRHNIPDYCNDLNAMHEAEKVFTYEEAQQFEGELCGICGSENLHKEYPLPFEFSVAHATASQRAEAFLRTIGKWEGGSQ